MVPLKTEVLEFEAVYRYIHRPLWGENDTLEGSET